jgi:DNA processing protein
VPPASADCESWLRLSLVPGLGNAALRKLLTVFGSPESVLAADSRALETIVQSDIATAIKSAGASTAVAQTLSWLEGAGNRIVTIADVDYPQYLLQTSDPPLLLYLKGREDLLNRASIAIVGSRNATPQGLAIAEDFARALSDGGVTIVSGLALGIDAAAHRGGLAGGGSSVAVVGTGLDVVYPARNRALAHELAERGVLVSEFPLGTAPIASNFPRRNRVISGMCRGCLIVEAASQSGSLITARLANEQGREVFAVPGSIHSPLSKGCHALIKQGAKLVESAGDILEELALPAPASTRAEPVPVSNEDAARLLVHLGYAACDLDTLSERSAFPAAKVAALLLDLELQGVVASMPGGFYQRVR